MPVTVPAWFVGSVLLFTAIVLIARALALREPADLRLTRAVSWLWVALVGKTVPVQQLAEQLHLISALRVGIHLACMLAAVALAGVARRARFGAHEPHGRYRLTMWTTAALGIPMLTIVVFKGQPEDTGWWGVCYFVMFALPIAYGLSVGLAALTAARRVKEGRGAAIVLAVLFLVMFVDTVSNLIAALDRALDASGVAAAARAATTGSVFVAFVGVAGLLIAVSGFVTYQRGVPGRDRLHVSRVISMWSAFTGVHVDVRLLEKADWWLLSAEELTMRLRVETMDSWRRLHNDHPDFGAVPQDAHSVRSALTAFFAGSHSSVPPPAPSLEAFDKVASAWPSR